MFLSHDEVKHLTGRVKRLAQIRQLDRLGVRYYLDADGHPVVPRSQIEPAQPAAAEPEPDWSALHAPAKKAS